jgi:hypothetical protein
VEDQIDADGKYSRERVQPPEDEPAAVHALLSVVLHVSVVPDPSNKPPVVQEMRTFPARDNAA